MITLHASVTRTHDGQYKPRVLVNRDGRTVQSLRLTKLYKDKNEARNVAREHAHNAMAVLKADLPGFPVQVH